MAGQAAFRTFASSVPRAGKCTKCGEDKLASEFYKGRSRKCKECRKQITRDWTKNNPEKAKEYVDKNREKINQRMLERYHKDPNVSKRYRDKNREKIAAYNIAWKNLNKEKVAIHKAKSRQRLMCRAQEMT